MCAMGFTEAFVELFKINSATFIFSCCGYIFFKMRRMDMVLLKARLFLNRTIIHHTWIYISIAGISIALGTLIKLVVSVTDADGIPYSYYIVGLIQIIFLIAFTLLVYSWYLFVSDYADELHYS